MTNEPKSRPANAKTINPPLKSRPVFPGNREQQLVDDRYRKNPWFREKRRGVRTPDRA